MGLPPPPFPHLRPASRRLCSSGEARSNEIAVGKGPNRLGGSGPLDDLKALFLLKLVEWWCEITHRDAIPPATDATAVTKTVPSRLRPVRGTSPSTVESPGDETEGFVAVVIGGRGGTRRKGRRPEAQPLPTAHSPTEDARAEGRASSSLSLSRVEFWLPRVTPNAMVLARFLTVWPPRPTHCYTDPQQT
jgi:hypothetical protein